MEQVTQFIDGSWTHAHSDASVIVSRNPYQPDEITATAEEADPADVTAAVESARRQRDWAMAEPRVRSAALTAIADAIARDSAGMARAISKEVAKPIAEARAEVAIAVEVLRFYGQHLLMEHGFTFPAVRGQVSATQRFPLGVVGVITPFNFPLAIPIWKMAPAIAYGCTVVWKPAPSAIGVASRLSRIMGRELPNGVLNLVNGGASVVAGLIASGLDGVSFTGSTIAGRDIALASLSAGVAYQCEMGGSNASVILRDADLDAASASCAAAAFGYSGQKCTATSRLIIDKAVKYPFLKRLGAVVESLPMGDPQQEGTVLVPLISAAQARSVEARQRKARQQLGQAMIYRKGQSLDEHWADVGIFGPVDPADELATAETFGPFAVVIEVDGLDEAIDAANVGPFGLAAAIYTDSLKAALGFSNRASAGTIRVNRTTTGLDVPVPFGGEGDSGLGPKELGTAAIDFYTRTRSIWLGIPG